MSLPTQESRHEPVPQIELDTLYTLAAAARPTLTVAGMYRHQAETRDMQLVLDSVSDASADCLSIRSTANCSFRLSGEYRLQRCAAGGWILQNRQAALPSYWLPTPAILRRLSTQAHILAERDAQLDDFGLDNSGASVSFSETPKDWIFDAVLWRLHKPALVAELQTPVAVETRGYFKLGSHSQYSRIADVYRHLIHGKIYEDRYAWPHQRRIFSENDAHALYLILSGLQGATGKRIYAMLKAQILLSVLSRQGTDGAFRHGEWTDRMESHYRLHCSALHLMMDALAGDDDPVVRAALTRGIAFIADKYDATAVGAWFYHDELETSEGGMRGAPFKWWPGRALGKSPQNMLVLNTHLDTLVALRRYGELVGDTQYATLVDSGCRAALALLALRPMEWLYRLVFSAIDLTLLPTDTAMRLPRWKRLWKRIGWQIFIPRLPRLKTRFPRLVMPGGYIDRELSLQTWAYDYLAVNLMDLVRIARGAQAASFMPYVDSILDYCARTNIARRWLEHSGRAYALGFYAEALVLLGMTRPRADTDAMLAEALLLCVQHGLGLPPSINGGNAEALAIAHALPRSSKAAIVVVNLSRSERAACLVLNVGDAAEQLASVFDTIPPNWTIPAQTLMPGAWARIEA
jgi:hypothetical protein